MSKKNLGNDEGQAVFQKSLRASNNGMLPYGAIKATSEMLNDFSRTINRTWSCANGT